MNGDQQISYKNEIIKGIDYKPTRKEGSFQWRVFVESGNMYSFFAPTFDQNQTTLQGMSAPHAVKIGYTSRFFNGKTYFNLMSITREMQSNESSPALDPAIQEQMTMDPPAQPAMDAPLDEPEFINEPQEPQTMMNDPVARATITVGMLNIYNSYGLLGKTAETIMKKAYGLIEAMDALGK